MSTLITVANEVRRGRRSAESEAREAIERHAEMGDEFRAYIEFDAEGAVEQAVATDARVAAGQDPGRLAGVTVSVKDLYGVSGLPTRAGTVAPLSSEWEQEGFLVGALRNQGATIIGKTHTVEMAFGAVGINPHHPMPVNPWSEDAERVPGGSSSGAGVSLWEGSARIALGSDTGGSIRIPAAVTGTVGHKQTAGRWPATGIVPLSYTLDTVGYLTKTVAETAYVFGALDPALRNDEGWYDGLSDTAVQGLRIGIPGTSGRWTEAESGVATAAKTALAELEAAGATLIEVDAPELDRATAAYMESGMVAAECAAFMGRDLPDRVERLDPIIVGRLEATGTVSAIQYLDTLHLRGALQRTFERLFEHVDVVATPTVSITARAASDLQHLPSYFETNRLMLSSTCPVSFMDLCALSLPAGLVGGSLPVGLQLIGPHGADVDLLRWGVAAERTLGSTEQRLGRPPRVAG